MVKHYFSRYIMNFLADGAGDALVHIHINYIIEILSLLLFLGYKFSEKRIM